MPAGIALSSSKSRSPYSPGRFPSWVVINTKSAPRSRSDFDSRTVGSTKERKSKSLIFWGNVLPVVVWVVKPMMPTLYFPAFTNTLGKRLFSRHNSPVFLRYILACTKGNLAWEKRSLIWPRLSGSPLVRGP